MDIIEGLNKQQKQAVTAGLGQVLVLAGPGSGKTKVLTSRVAYLIQYMGVNPFQILSVTFTNKAAREMENRLTNLIGDLKGSWTGTFHGLCARILRREARYLPLGSNYVIMDADDQRTLTKNILKEMNVDDKQFRPAQVHGAISNAKNLLLGPEDYIVSSYREEVILRVFKRYQETLEANNAVDFDDLLVWTVKLLNENDIVREEYARRFYHVLADEFQDTNQAQYMILRLLSSYHHNIFVVGDEDQSIYRWRGADYRNIIRFEEDYPKVQKVLLEKNYRSTQNVLDAAMAVIGKNQNRTHKQLFTDRGDGDRITIYEGEDDKAEAAFVLDTIMQNKSQAKNFAIMYRTNAQSRLLEEAFLRAGIAYRLVGAQRFYGRKEIKDILAYLRVIYNPLDEISLIRVINVPSRKIGAKKIEELRFVAYKSQISPGRLLIDLGKNGEKSAFFDLFSSRGAATALMNFAADFSKWVELSDEISLLELFDCILTDLDYQTYLEENQKDAQEGIDRWENIQELRRLVFEYNEHGLAAFLENLALVSDQDTVPEEADAPTLLTLHAAKGLEFSHVILVGVDEGLLPHSRSLFDDEEMEEERRLMYVGMTRAMNKLYLVRAERRSNYGSYEYTEPSRFLSDIPDELIQYVGMRRNLGSFSYPVSEKANIAINNHSRWDNREMPSKVTKAVRRPVSEPVEIEFSPGMRVNHPSWGEGIVIESRIQDGEETVDVAFNSVGFKRLIASLANLEKLD